MMQKMLAVVVIVASIVLGVHKYEETWEYDTPVCGYQAHAMQCLDGKFMIEY